MLVLVEIPVPSVMAKYTVFGVTPSGKCPSSLNTRIDSPFRKLCAAFSVMTFAVPPSLLDPILLIPATLRLTLNIFSELKSESGIVIRAVYSVVLEP